MQKARVYLDAFGAEVLLNRSSRKNPAAPRKGPPCFQGGPLRMDSTIHCREAENMSPLFEVAFEKTAALRLLL